MIVYGVVPALAALHHGRDHVVVAAGDNFYFADKAVLRENSAGKNFVAFGFLNGGLQFPGCARGEV